MSAEYRRSWTPLTPCSTRSTASMTAPEVVTAAVRAGHDRGKLVLAHALTLDATAQTIAAGADGLAHLFVDTGHTAAIIETIAESAAFVVATLSTLASITGQPARADLARDPRVQSKVDPVWLDNLATTYQTLPPTNFQMALDTAAALHEAGVDVLAGTDAAHLGAAGTAHGASLHDELRLLVQAGWTPVEALRAATWLPAQRFALGDRGAIRSGYRADLLLVDGDPTKNIGDTLSIQAVWRQGTRVAIPVSV